MPGYGASNEPPYRVYLKDFNGSDDWVDFKARRTPDQARALEKITRDPQSTNTDAGAVMFRLFVVGWSLKAKETDSEPMPCNEATFLSELDLDVATFIIQQMMEYYNNRKMTPDLVGNSNGRSLVH
jgi:hypothetical protein